MGTRIDLTGPLEFKPENRKPKPAKERALIVRFRGSGRKTFIPLSGAGKHNDRQRVMVKARSVKGRRNGSAEGLRKHLSYLERSGVGIDGKKPEFLSRDGVTDSREVRQQVALWSADHHHFRFIVSPERTEGVNLEKFASTLVHRIEDKLGTGLEWFAAVHHNTDNPHIHLLVRGKDDRGNDLILERDFIKEGIRGIAEDLLTKEIGPRTLEDRRVELEKSIVARSFTGIDRGILQHTKDGMYRPDASSKSDREWEREGQRRKLSRLQFLSTLGLAKEGVGGIWQLSESLENDLRALAHRLDVQRRLSDHLKERVIGRDIIIIDGPSDLSQAVQGKLVARGISNELTDGVFVAIEDGQQRIFYAELGEYSEPKGFEAGVGAIVKIQFPQHGRADDLIHAFAKERGGLFNINEFSNAVQQEVESGMRKLPGGLGVDDYLKAYGERLKNLTSLGFTSKVDEGTWRIPEDLKEVVEEHEKKIGRKQSVQLNTMSYLNLEEQVSAHGATWLDRLLSNPERKIKEFGNEVEDAIKRRELILNERGIQIDRHLIRKLYSYELSIVEKQLSSTVGPTQKVGPGTTAVGKIADYRLLSNGYHVVIKRETGYSIIPMPYRTSRIEKGAQVEFGIEAGSKRQGHFLRVSKDRSIERGG